MAPASLESLPGVPCNTQGVRCGSASHYRMLHCALVLLGVSTGVGRDGINDLEVWLNIHPRLLTANLGVYYG